MYKTARKKFKSDYDLEDDIQQIKEALANTASDVRGRAGEMLNRSIEDMKDKTLNVQNDVSDFILERPIKTLSVTFLIGLAIGYLLHR